MQQRVWPLRSSCREAVCRHGLLAAYWADPPDLKAQRRSVRARVGGLGAARARSAIRPDLRCGVGLVFVR